MDFVPIQYYSPFFFHFVLIVSFFVFFQSLNTKIESTSNLQYKKIFGGIIITLLIFYMGLRPVNYRFGDMVIYNTELQSLMSGNPPSGKVEPLFTKLMQFFASIGSPTLFFFTCSFFYIFPLYIVSKRLFKDYWFYCFLIMISAFTFWAFGVNGIRNGMATSLFLLAITEKNKVLKYGILFGTILIHKSLMLPILAYFISKYVTNVKYYFIFWLLCIPLSLALGSFLEVFFLQLGFADDQKMDVYLSQLNQVSEGVELKLGFRWDFLLYSASAVFAAWYYIFKKKVEDVFYNHLVNVYLLVNAFWILIIRANYSNRFAYLSWFLMGIIILYPLLKYQLFNKQHALVGKIILVFCFLGYLLNVILI